MRQSPIATARRTVMASRTNPRCLVTLRLQACGAANWLELVKLELSRNTLSMAVRPHVQMIGKQTVSHVSRGTVRTVDQALTEHRDGKGLRIVQLRMAARLSCVRMWKQIGPGCCGTATLRLAY